MAVPKKKRVFDSDFLKRKKKELKEAIRKFKEGDQMAIGFALESAGKGETISIMMPPSSRSFEIKAGTLVAAGDLVVLDASGKAVPCECEKEDETLKKDTCYGVVEIEDEFVKEILQTICGDLLGKDVKKFRFDRTKKVWEVVVESNRSMHTDISGFLPVISKIYGSSSHKVTNEESFRRNRKIKKKASKGKAIGLKMNIRRKLLV